MSTTCALQSRRFFAALCFANKNISIFEKQLADLPEEDWPLVLLASIIFENCGLARLKNDLERAQAADGEYWVPIPNQYILKDKAWLFPVITACDPEKATFREDDYGFQLIEKVSEKLNIKLKTNDPVILVELKHCLKMMAHLLTRPWLVGMSQIEIKCVLRDILTEEVFHIICHDQRRIREKLKDTEPDDIFQGIKALAFMIALFVSTGLVFGFYCKDLAAGSGTKSDLVTVRV